MRISGNTALCITVVELIAVLILVNNEGMRSALYRMFIGTQLNDDAVIKILLSSPAATPLSGGKEITLIDVFIGKTPGCIGEVSVLALLIGAVYLIVKRVIDPKIPTIFIFTTIITLILTGTNINAIPIQIFSGGIILGAFYMATDYSTSPVSSKGRCIYALGCGFITAIIRRFGALPEGVSYAILFMNILTPLIEKLTVPKSFGGGKNERKS